MNFRIFSTVTFVLTYAKAGGFSGIGSKKMSLSLLAALASSDPQKAFFIMSFPKTPLNLGSASPVSNS